MTDSEPLRGADSPRIVLSGARVVLSDRVIDSASLVLEAGRIVEIGKGALPVDAAKGDLDLSGHVIVPGFIDVHVHGVEGTDTLDGAHAIARIAERLPRYGVTSFCPTTVACAPDALGTMLEAVRAARAAASGARVLPAHLESNFINPDYRGAQPLDCIRLPRGLSSDGSYSGPDILETIEKARADVGIMTIAPELDAAIDLIRNLAAKGIAISLGHSGASYEQAKEGIAAGARQATHLFNRMTPLNHRAPGLAAAVLESEETAAEVICDGVHVHPAMVRLAFAAKGPAGIMAITDGTAGSGMPFGYRAKLGGRTITVRDAAYLDDGTFAGSVLTMDRAFAKLVRDIGLSLPEAARICSTTPARALGLARTGELVRGFAADLIVFDSNLEMAATFIAGTSAWSSG